MCKLRGKELLRLALDLVQVVTVGSLLFLFNVQVCFAFLLFVSFFMACNLTAQLLCKACLAVNKIERRVQNLAAFCFLGRY